MKLAGLATIAVGSAAAARVLYVDIAAAIDFVANDATGAVACARDGEQWLLRIGDPELVAAAADPVASTPPTLRLYALSLLAELLDLDTLADVDAVLDQLRRPGIGGLLGELRRRWVAERGGAP